MVLLGDDHPCLIQVALLRYMKEKNIVDVRAPSLEITQFGHGQSNPTYLVKVLFCRPLPRIEYFMPVVNCSRFQ